MTTLPFDGRVGERSEPGWGGRFVPIQDASHNLHHALRIRHHVVVPETQHGEAVAAQMGIAFRIAAAVGLHVVLATIELDHEARGEAGEIHDEVIDWDLTAEMEAVGSQQSKRLP